VQHNPVWLWNCSRPSVYNVGSFAVTFIIRQKGRKWGKVSAPLDNHPFRPAETFSQNMRIFKPPTTPALDIEAAHLSATSPQVTYIFSPHFNVGARLSNIPLQYIMVSRLSNIPLEHYKKNLEHLTLLQLQDLQTFHCATHCPETFNILPHRKTF
jgi:hypothetical protein